MDSNSVTIITGGGRGIGRAIALRMAKETVVHVFGRERENLVRVCDQITRNGGKAGCSTGDVRGSFTAQSVVAFCKAGGLRIRNLVCNAALAKSGVTESFDSQLWKDIIDVNVNGSFHFIQACLPHMIKGGGGNIVLMSSMAGLKGYSHIAAYTASKHALVGLAKALASEYGKHGIVSVAICPGFVESEMTTRSIKSLAVRRGITEDKARERIARVNPQHRIIPAEEVAEAVAFVCSGKVPSLSGSALVLGGGE